ncbi:MAG: glycerol-3-phosphate dehydrogenase/oxidase [Chloracidobacterium sp.]|nr:glycerol-3-phosphate dehydrogenase/oxidase [Chloracidobacterium sp.]
MDRNKNLKFVREHNEPWDVVVIGGGATGAGCALDAASRGFSVLLLEQHDFGKGTSSRSTKLIHGGVRYLKQGNISLVREALRERALLLKNAPDAIHIREFIIPCYSIWQKLLYGAGIAVYTLLAGRHGIGHSRILSREETLRRLPTLEPEGLSGGVLYHDGQFDDARFLIDLLRAANSHDAVVLNYCKAASVIKDETGRINGVEFIDEETGDRFAVAARSVINAAGVFSDSVRRMSNDTAPPLLAYAQGIHIVLDRKFLPTDDAMMIPKTADGRVLFCIPWHGRVLVGTTDTAIERPELEPRALGREIDFVLETAGQYLANKPTRADILSTFAGIRPLISRKAGAKTSSLSRGHELFVDNSGLVTITGGKWTTYRQMAEDAVDKAIEVAGLERRKCITSTLRIDAPPANGPGTRLHPKFEYTHEDVVRAVREEMARTAEDVLFRRTRMAYLDQNAAAEAAPAVIEIVKNELGKDDAWSKAQLVEIANLLKTPSGAVPNFHD